MLESILIGTERVRPYADNVLVRVDRNQWLRSETQSTIILPDAVAAPEVGDSLVGEVIAVGPGYHPEVRAIPDRSTGDERGDDTSPRLDRRVRIPCCVAVGERVLLRSTLSGQRWWDDGTEYRMVRDCELLGVVEE